MLNITGPSLPMSMENHCMEVILEDLFVLDENLDVFIYKSDARIWTKISSTFPCDNKNQSKVICKTFGSNHIIAPNVLNDSACTGIFDLKKQEWTTLEIDQRSGLYNGTIQHLPNIENQEILLFFGGYKLGNDIREEVIWEFIGLEDGWKEFPVKLSKDLKEKGLVFSLMHPETNFCPD